MADHTRNQSIAAADQLFGSSDSSADFFASVVGDSQSAPEPASEHVPPAAPQDAGGLFDSTTGADSLFDSAPGQDAAVLDAFDVQSEQSQQTAVDDATYSEHTDYSQLGWYDEHGQWHYYEAQDASQTTEYQTDPYAPQDASGAYGQPAAAGTTHDPYAPTYASQQSAPAAEASYYGYDQSASYAPTTDTTTSQYYAQNSYVPSNTTSSAYAPPPVQVPDPYAPSVATYQPAAAYDPYKPAANAAASSVSATSSAYASPSYASSNYAPTSTPSYPSYASPAVNSAPAPAAASLSRDDTIKPRKVSVEQYRSHSYNAYDPPMPAVQPRARVTSASPPALHTPSTGFDAYNRNSSPAPPVAPVAPHPPRTVAAAAPPPPRAGSAMSTRVVSAYAQPRVDSPQINGAVAPDSTGASFFASLQPPRQAYSLNSPGHPSQPLDPEVPLDEPTYGFGATPGISTAGVNGGTYASTFDDQDDPEGGIPDEGFSHNEAQSYQPLSHPAAPSQEAYNAYAPRPASRPSSVTSPPPRPSSVASQPSYAPGSRSASPAIRAAVASPPPRVSSVASPPPRAPSVSSPPPRAPSVASITSQAASIHGRYAPSNQAGSPPPQVPTGPTKASPQDPYAPKTAIRRETSDYTPSVPSASPPQQFDPYRPRGASIASAVSSKAASPPPPAWGAPTITNALPPPLNGTSPYAPKVDPYAPSNAYAPQTSRREASEVSDYGDYASRYASGNHVADDAKSVASDVGGGSVLNTTATYTQYAPSPSLSGTNDPLGRASARVPLFSFGFGGKFVMCFHTPAGLTDGFDVSFSARPSTTVQIKRLHEIIPQSAWDTSTAVFPGPLVSDPGSPTSSLVPPVRSNNSKAKKAVVLKYLETRIEESEKGLTYVTQNSVEYHKAEGKLVLLRLLKVVVENDGQFSGSEKIEAAVRSALLGTRADSGSTGLDNMRPADSFASAYGSGSPSEAPLAVYELRSSALEKLQEFLLRGERRKAYHYALDEKMWAHALLLANGLDKDSWKEAVQEFLRAELMSPGQGSSSASNGRESLRIMYSLIAGQGAAAVQELVPPRALGQPRVADSGASLAAAATPMHITPMTANFTQASIPTNVPVDILARWPDIASTVVSNHVQGDSSGLTALGDTLAAHKWVEPAHACYLLSRSTSTISGCSNTSAARIVLLGSANPAITHNFCKDQDPFIFSEILEFALSLAPATAGQEAFTGFAHLQAYRLLRAWHLVEMGYDRQAQRYCDAIAATVRGTNRGSPFFTLTFLEQLKELSDRLVAAPQLDKGGSWLTKKMAKPSLDSLGTWLGGRLTDFIAGEDQESTPSSEVTAEQAPQPSMGPFSHYSTISSATSSASPSPPPGATNPNRTASALSFRGPAAPNIHVERASSAMDYLRPNANRVSPVPRIASANAATTTFSQAANSRYGHAPQHAAYPSFTQAAKQGAGDDATEGQEVSMPWWGSSYGEDTGATPTAASFVRAEEPAETDTGGFISLMDTPSPAPSVAPSHNASRSASTLDDDEDDLGFGNSRKKTRDDDEVKKAEASKPAETKPAAAEPAKPASGGGWISRLWGGKSSTPAPVKANLGEETSFYYDKELKRWVNKKAGATAAPATPPPPPPRAQTASPSLARPAASTPPPPLPAGPPKINRPASVADLTLSSPPVGAKPPRARSNLVPTDEDGAAGSLSVPGTPPPSGAATPPIRPKSQASAKRNVRSRYVDVFQQGGGS